MANDFAGEIEEQVSHGRDDIGWRRPLLFDGQQQVLGLNVLTRFHQDPTDTPADWGVDGALHLHGFQREQFFSPLHSLFQLDKDVGDDPGGRWTHVPRLAGTDLGVGRSDFFSGYHP